MRIALVTAGSRGDVEPFAALARRAIDAGHDVALAVPQDPGVDLSGLPVRHLRISFHDLVGDAGVSPVAALRTFRSTIRPAMARMLEDALRTILQLRPDVVVHHPKVLTAPVAATHLGVPSVVVSAVPALSATRAFPAPGVVARDLGGPLNRLTYSALRGSSAMFAGDVRRAARRAGVSGPADPPHASLAPVSPELLSRPADWPASARLTGSWPPATGGAALPAGVQAFMDRGPFLYAGFGSMTGGDPLERARTVIVSARVVGLRILLATGWGGLALPRDLAGDGDVLAVPEVDHDVVLPRAEVAVHHGGAGTVHAALRAGTPSVVVPFAADQAFWGAAVAARGLGPAPVPSTKLSRGRLQPALERALTQRAHVAQVGARVRAEDGIAVTLEVLADAVGTAYAA